MASSSSSSSVPADATTAKVAERLSQCILSISNLAELIRNSSPTQSISKIPKDLLAKTPHINNTGKLLEQMPGVISALDAKLDRLLSILSELEASSHRDK